MTEFQGMAMLETVVTMGVVITVNLGSIIRVAVEEHTFKSKSAEPCRWFSRGKCNLGSACTYDHRCAYAPCNKFVHSILNCRKLMADKERNKGTGNQGSGPVSGSSDAKISNT